MLKRFLCLMLLWVAAGAWARAAPAPVILVMGDSLSAAYGIETSRGWVALLQERLQAHGYDYHVVNASVSGDTSAQGLTRLPLELAQHRPAIVILELGANDGLRGLSITAMRDNLAHMIQLSEKTGAKVLLVGIYLPPNYGPQYTGQFAAVYPQLARQYHLSLVPFLLAGVAEHRDLMQSDGLHPIASAEPQVLENIWPELEPLLRRKQAGAAKK